MFHFPRLLRGLLAAFAICSSPCEGHAAEPIDFNRDIRPILSNHCFKCHGPGTHKGELRLDSRDLAIRKKAVVAGKSGESLLIQKIMAGDAERMPPKSASDRLTETQVAKLRAWIDQGASYSQHWAYVKPKAEPLPAVSDKAWPRNPIDSFILAKLDGVGLKPSVAAERTTLIRRLYLDLLGLLPSPAEVEEFLRESDAKPQTAYEALVDRILASPHFGERQARHWLDMARYADSNGFTIDGARSMWPYRDWVIDSINRDMPFDQFTIEQLAGDLLPSASKQQLVATGFHRNTPLNEEGGTDAEQFRAERTVDRVNTTGAVWLGLTVGCAQCHDHKYDAFSQKDYYRLYAFFNAVSEPTLRMGTPEQEKHLADLNAQLAKAKAVKFEGKGASPEVQKLQKEIKALETKIPASLIVGHYPRPTNIHLRGDFLLKGEAVTAGTPSALPALAAKPSAALSRLDLAKWLVSSDNPLTARVTVNRIWQQYFGKGLVETENDFGMQGRAPTHPELLDWLAAEFVRSGWAVKKMHKLIVMSAAYRQSSVARADLREKDPNNLLLGRQNRLRVEAEIIRDSALTASGLLTRKIGGPGVYPPQPKEVFSFTQASKPWPESQGPDRYRRGMYTYIWRQSQHPLLTTFDAADAQVACTHRNRSNTPLQALHLANDPVFVEIAAALGKRIVKEGPADEPGRIDFAFALCYSRKPESTEKERLLRYRESMKEIAPEKAWMLISRVLLNLDEFITRE